MLFEHSKNSSFHRLAVNVPKNSQKIQSWAPTPPHKKNLDTPLCNKPEARMNSVFLYWSRPLVIRLTTQSWVRALMSTVQQKLTQIILPREGIFFDPLPLNSYVLAWGFIVLSEHIHVLITFGEVSKSTKIHSTNWASLCQGWQCFGQRYYTFSTVLF